MASKTHNYRRMQLITLAVISAILFLNAGCGNSRSSKFNRYSNLTGATGQDRNGGSSLKVNWREAASSSDESAEISNWEQGETSTLSPLPPQAPTQPPQTLGELDICYRNVHQQGITNLGNAQFSVQSVFVGAGAELVKCYEFIRDRRRQLYNQDLVRRWNEYRQLIVILQSQAQQRPNTSVSLPRPPTIR
jgi:hypothetical protein